VALFNLFQNPTGQTGAREITYSQFRSDTNEGNVESVVISGQEITGTYTDKSRFRTTAPENPARASPPARGVRRQPGAAPNSRPRRERGGVCCPACPPRCFPIHRRPTPTAEPRVGCAAASPASPDGCTAR
jgi:hypothetical protein